MTSTWDMENRPLALWPTPRPEFSMVVPTPPTVLPAMVPPAWMAVDAAPYTLSTTQSFAHWNILTIGL